MNKPKFKKGSTVGTNIKYMHGFGENHFAPSGLKRLQELEVVSINCIDSKECSNGKAGNDLYTLKSKSREYLINECFLEQS